MLLNILYFCFTAAVVVVVRLLVGKDAAYQRLVYLVRQVRDGLLGAVGAGGAGVEVVMVGVGVLLIVFGLTVHQELHVGCKTKVKNIEQHVVSSYINYIPRWAQYVVFL